MSDLINRRAAIDALNCDLIVTGEENAKRVGETLKTVFNRLYALPSAEPKKGKWINENRAFWDIATCSYCGEVVIGIGNFCTNCGADMR